MNKKKAIFIVTFLIIISWFVYQTHFLTREKSVVVENGINNSPTDKLLPPSLKLTQPTIGQPRDPQKKNFKIRENPDEKFEAFDKLEKDWLNKVESILGPEKYPLYIEMRNQNEKEKLQAYKEYHNYLRKKFGDKFSYKISDDQSVREKKINQKYLDSLLKLIGPENFKDYTAAKDQFNEEIRRKNKESIVIEF